MRHVTDGELHAYLDGALDLLPEGRGEEIRDHISECSVCRERLQDEELVRSQATEILADPDLSGVTFPSFEELRERAEAPGSGVSAGEGEEKAKVRYRGPLRGLPLAWAATIVLAIGVGWMGGQMMGPVPSRTPEGRFLDFGAEDLSVAPDPASADSDSSRLDVVRVSRGDQESVSAPALVHTEPAEATREGVQPEVAGVARRRDTVIEPEQTVPAVEAAVVGAAREEARAADPKTPPSGAQPTRERPGILAEEIPLEALVVTGDSLSEAARFAAAEAAEQAEAGLASVSDSLKNSLTVPGLKVVSIEWEERVEGEKALLIRQLLSPGDTLELRYLGMLLGTEPEPTLALARSIPREEGAGVRLYANVLEASLPTGWNQVVMEWGRGLLVARAPVSEANLKALLKSLH
jgi:hypothetical protein